RRKKSMCTYSGRKWKASMPATVGNYVFLRDICSNRRSRVGIVSHAIKRRLVTVRMVLVQRLLLFLPLVAPPPTRCARAQFWRPAHAWLFLCTAIKFLWARMLIPICVGTVILLVGMGLLLVVSKSVWALRCPAGTV